MAEHLVDGPPNAKRQKLDPFQGPPDGAVYNYGLGPSSMGGGMLSNNPSQQQWNLCQQNVLSNMDMFDLEKDLPDELISPPSWGFTENILGPNKPTPHGPGPGGSMQNGGLNDGVDGGQQMRQIQLDLLQGNNKLLSSTLAMAGGQLKNQNLQSPPNVAVAKSEQMNMRSLPSSMPNSGAMQQSMANNGSTPQLINSIQGINNSAGGNMILSNNTMCTQMAGGGLVVSSTVNKPLPNPNMMAPGQGHHPGNHAVPQQVMQNGPMNRLHLNTRPTGAHAIHQAAMAANARMQTTNSMLTQINQNLPPGAPSPYLYQNQPGAPTVPPGVATPQPHPNKIGSMAGAPPPSAPSSSAPVRFPQPPPDPNPNSGGIAQTQLPAPSPAQPQSGAPSGSQPGPQTATQNAPPPSGPPPPSSTDPEKRKLIQQQLVLLLHAHKCQRRETQANNGEVWQCNLPHCKTMKNVLNHMTTCNAGKTCGVPHCSSSRQIISHWKHCTKTDCPVCLPLKQADKNRNNSTTNAAQPTTQNPTAQPINASDMRRACDGLGILPPTSGATTPMMPNMQLGPRLTRPPLPTAPQMRPMLTSATQPPPNVSLPLGSDPTSNNNNAQSSTTTTHNLLSQQAIFSNLSNEQQGLLGGNSQLAGHVTASPVQGTKEWHQSVTPDLRNHLVHKLVQAIFPTPDPQAMLDKRMHNLVAYARKVEGDMYEMANSRSEYYHLLAEKIYKIQKELEEKRIKRKEAQNAAANQPVRPPPMGVRPNLPPPNRSNSPALPLGLNPNRFIPQPPTPSVGLPGPSPTHVPNPGLSPFAQPFNGVSLPQVSPQFNAPAPSPSAFGLQTTPVNRIQTPNSEMVGPKSVSSSRGASPAPATPIQSSPATSAASLGKGMTSAERAAQNAPRQSSMSSQMAAITAAHDRDEDSPSPPSKKGKQMKEMDVKHIKQEIDEDHPGLNNDSNSGSGMGVGKARSEVKMEIKSEIKSEVIDGTDGIKTEVKEEMVDSKGGLVFKPDELRQKLMPTLEKLYRQDPESGPFRQPVDPVGLGIPDYFDLVKRPMDLSTIKKKLDIGQYADPWEYVDDVWLMFDNAWLYNRKTSRVYRYCTKLSEVFETEIDPVMQSMGYCCGRKYTFNPQVLCCYGKQLCTIPRDAKYYSYQNSLKAYGLGSDRYTFCQKCFNDIQGDTVTLGDDPTQAQTAIKKDQFKEMKNNHLEMEVFVNCKACRRKLHQICVLHNENIWTQGFSCDDCLVKKGQKRRDNKFNAKRLTITKLGIYIETRVNNFLKKKEAGAGEVSIRVVSSSDKMVEIKPGMRTKFVDSGEMSSEFPYRAKALFAFEEIDGVDVCFFGMHVQEYGSECSAPNTRRVYIAYLDSVHFFKPRQFRTAVYHEILLGYMDYVKQLGYTMAHIWACPPSEGDDYIFHCHPLEQKIPKPKRLQDWYKKMLDKGIIERIVVDYKDILKQAMEDNLRSAADLPYFEGDFWPNVLEESIKELDQEEEEKRKQAEAAELAANALFQMSEECETGSDGKKKGQKKAKKNNKAKANQRKNSKKSNTPQTGNDLSAKIFETMEKHKEVFFVIRLHSVQSAASLGPIQDPDPFINCDLMDGRDAFLTLAREKHYEFSSLRRAKFSTMSMLYELHNQGQDKFVYTCNHCKGQVETRYHCTECDDFDLCTVCYEKEGHPHRMERLGFEIDDGSAGGDQKQAGDPQQARKLSIQRCIQSLVHACQCRDANCRLTSCQKMKRVVQHTKVCKRKTNGGCPICKQLIALCCYHAKHCTETKCPVPFCSNIKHKLKQQQLQQRLQQAQLLRRRMAVMNTRTLPQGGSSGGIMSSVQAVVPGAVSPAMNSIALGNTGLPHQAGVGLKPGTQTPPANVLQVVKQVQEEAARQQAPHAGYGKAAPGGNGPPSMPPPQLRAMAHLPPQPAAGAPDGGNLLPMGAWPGRYAGPPAARPPAGLMQCGSAGPGPGGPPGGGMQPVRPAGVGVGAGLANPATLLQKQALQQLMQTLRSPQSPEQQQQILSILKANPQLMAAFIKQRQAQMHQATGAGVVSGAPPPQQLQHILSQQNPGQQQPQQQQQQQQQQQPQQHPQQPNRLQMPPGAGVTGGGQNMMGQVPPQINPSNQQQLTPQQQQQHWYKVMALRQQQAQQQAAQQQAQQQQQQQQQQAQQQQSFQQPNAPPSYQQRLPAIRQPHMGYNNTYQEQQFANQMQAGGVGGGGGGMKPNQSPVPSPQGVMGPPQGITVQQQQQLMQSVRSPPPIRSPQPSPRPLASPRNQAVPSPRGNQHDLAASEILLGGSGGGAPGHPHPSPVSGGPDGGNGGANGGSGSNDGQTQMTPQDQLSKFVEQL